jgi:two-component sensor histidine kinase
MRFAVSFRPLLKDWLLSFLGWTGLGLVQGAPGLAIGQLNWTDALMLTARDWLPWAILTPLIWRLVTRLPLDRRTWLRAVPAHLAVCLAALLLCHFWKETTGGHLPRGIRQGRFALPPGGPGPEREGLPLPPPPGEDGPMLEEPGPISPAASWLGLLHFAGFELPTYLLILSASHAVLFYRREREREAGLARTRLEILKMRLQPHFLFNTLNTISGLVHSEPDKADEMLTALSELLRMTLRNSTAFILPLCREMEFLERYVAIMKTRFEDRLQFETEIDADTQRALVPALLLQPLVENAVQHGLELGSRSGLVTVRAKRLGDMLQLCVCDNGVGIPDKSLDREGLGLGNTRDRLRELYGKRASLQLLNDNGLTVTIVIPYKLAE